MILTAKELEKLTDEQVVDYIQGINDFLNHVPFDASWNETRKEGYRDSKDEMKQLLTDIYMKMFHLDKNEASSNETINATNERRTA